MAGKGGGGGCGNMADISLKIYPPYREGLEMLDQFSHFQVIWWASNQDTEAARRIVKTPLPYAETPKPGFLPAGRNSGPTPLP